MKLIIGLGNFEKKYYETRHNVGFVVLDKIYEEISKFPNTQVSKWEENKKFKSLITNYQSLVLAKPTTFMNNSGDAVRFLTNYYHLQYPDLWIIHDDLDINLGQYKIQLGVGPKDHNGLNSIYEKLGTKEFWHLRVGIENRDREVRTPGEQYVLQKFTKEEKELRDRVVEKVAKEILSRIIAKMKSSIS